MLLRAGRALSPARPIYNGQGSVLANCFPPSSRVIFSHSFQAGKDKSRGRFLGNPSFKLCAAMPADKNVCGDQISELEFPRFARWSLSREMGSLLHELRIFLILSCRPKEIGDPTGRRKS